MLGYIEHAGLKVSQRTMSEKNTIETLNKTRAVAELWKLGIKPIYHHLSAAAALLHF